ncbi:MAG: polyprenyl synthetase family protein [Patescibacteria group bacterium]|nr:polyprenyl synthetase family protein [Patescibacteria group bacterium]
MSNQEKITDYFDRLKPEIDKIIEKYVPKKVSQKWLELVFEKPKYQYTIDAAQQVLLDPVWDFLDRGGKRWRPSLFLLVAEAVGGDVEKLKDFSIVPELIHNGSLIIDDIEDQGELRRGKPCLHKIFGIDIAINAGNFLYFLPLVVFKENKEKFDKEVFLNAYQIYAQEMLNIHLGQGTDIFWHKGKTENINEQEYFQMCIFKTGCLSRMAAKLAVVLSEKNNELTQKIGRIAEAIGVAFQIQDDILDIDLTGQDREKFGKSFGNDIKEGKRSLMVIHSLNKAGSEDKKRLLEILNKHTENIDEIEEAIKIIQKYESIDYAKGVAKDIIKHAWQDADKFLKESEAKQRLKSFIDYLIERKS